MNSKGQPRVYYREAQEERSYSAQYDALMRDSTNQLRIKTVQEHLPRLLPRGARVLDVACGGGAYLRAWVTSHGADGIEIFGLDREFNCAWAFHQGIHDASATVGDVTHPPFRPESFDVVLAADIVEHLEDDRLFLQEMRRI